jgi:DNA-binding response OmpR family regulator
MVPHILLVEDDVDISDVITMQLEKAGFKVSVAEDGGIALRLFESDPDAFDILILDWMLPVMSGYSFCLNVRRELKSEIPIIMVTAKTEPEHIIAGLDAGADDYVTKPFDMNIFLARIRAQLRRRETSGPEALSISSVGLKIDPMRYEVSVQGEFKRMTPSEFRILQCLMKKPGNVFTRRQIVEYINGKEQVKVTERVIDTHMVALRKKLGHVSKNVETIRGIGYKLIAPEV